MTRKSTRRKHYQLINAVAHAIQGAGITPDTALSSLRTRELGAIDAFVRGSATLGDWSDVNAMLSLAETMARAGIGREEVLPACAEAQTHLIEAARRYEKIKKMGTTGPGLESFRELFRWHDIQRTSVSRAEYEQAIQTTVNRLKSRAPEVVEL